MARSPSSEKSNVNRRNWTEEEDAKLLAYVSIHGSGNWDSVPEKAALDRSGKSCRHRWLHHLMPNRKQGRLSPQEEEKIISLHATIGSRWSIIASQLPGRTDNDVKNFWNSRISKKLLEQGIDPVTHRPISEINQFIASVPTTITASTSNSAQDHSPRGTPISNLNRDLNTLLSTSTPVSNDVSTITTATHASSNEASSSSTVVAPPDLGTLLSKSTPVISNDVSTITTATHAASNVTSSSPTMVAPPPELKWTDFLIEDLFVLDDEGASEPKLIEESTAVEQNGLVDEWWDAMDGNFQGSACDKSGSFVDSILDRHQETASQFPEFPDFLTYIDNIP